VCSGEFLYLGDDLGSSSRVAALTFFEWFSNCHADSSPFKVEQDRSFKVEQDKPFRVEQDKPFKVDQSTSSVITADGKTASGDLIRREVTVFSEVGHGPGQVVTGWNYKDGSGGVPVRQYCYYNAPNPDGSTTKVDIASDGVRLRSITASLVPNLEGALAKCQWLHLDASRL
jgi:hypothetical protein